MGEPASIGLDTETVGVIVPVRGEAPFLEEALTAILAQEPPPADVVVVDDASPDPVALPGAALAGCRLVRREARGGPAAARQTGLEALRTELVALCDSDDVWEPGKLAAQLAALERHPQAAACFGRATVVGPGGLATGERWEEPPEGAHGLDALLPTLYEHDPLPTSSMVLRRRALEEVGGFHSDLFQCEDWDLWLRLLAAGGSFVCVPTSRVRYRRHPDGLTADLVDLAKGSLQVHERHAGLVEPRLRARMLARDFTTLARGLIRRRDYAGARAALREAASHERPGPRERALALALAVPGVRGMLGRRRPYPARP